MAANANADAEAVQVKVDRICLSTYQPRLSWTVWGDGTPDSD